MKYFTYIITALLPVLLLVACAQEEMAGNEQNSDVITLNVTVSGTSAKTKAVIPESTESNISNLYILFYEIGGNKNDITPDFYYHETGVTGTEWEKTLLLSSTNLKKGGEYKVYTLANLPQTVVTSLTENMDEKKLLDLVEEIKVDHVRNSDGSDISFSSFLNKFPIKTGTNNKCEIKLSRTVARLDMNIDATAISNDWMIETVNIINEQLSTYYYKKNGSNTSSSTRVGQANRRLDADGKSQWRYYLYENPKELGEKVSLKINLKSKTDASATRSYTAIVNKKGDGELLRNNIYQSTILLTEQPDPVVVESNPVAWSDTVDIKAVIPSVYLDFPTETIRLTNRGAALYNFKSDADSVKIKMDMSNLIVESILGKTEGFIFPKAPGVYELNIYMSAYGLPEEKGTITFEAGNLTKVMEIVKPLSNVTFSYAISPCDDWLPGEVKQYDSLNDSEAKFDFAFSGVDGLEAWYGIQYIQQITPDGKVYNVGSFGPRTYQLSDQFDKNVEFRVMDILEKTTGANNANGYTFVYRLDCGTSKLSTGPIIKQFKFAIKINK
ncbi:hypothetical protein POZ03_01160 [Bacteroides uniformis]|uniref:hypothetical protein n=1 Tax=Bacteroides uniformis TaxID=820 RepID=UPI00233EBAB6|nr:hypothetical protein [Bacteroides uniformis]MDC1809066.1 hypothetical protein [Bacteroides uniformis]